MLIFMTDQALLMTSKKLDGYSLCSRPPTNELNGHSVPTIL